MKCPFAKTILVALGATLLVPSSVLAYSNNYWTTANYIAVLGNQHPDSGGWIFWTTLLNQGMSQTQLTDYFMSSG